MDSCFKTSKHLSINLSKHESVKASNVKTSICQWLWKCQNIQTVKTIKTVKTVKSIKSVKSVKTVKSVNNVKHVKYNVNAEKSKIFSYLILYQFDRLHGLTKWNNLTILCWLINMAFKFFDGLTICYLIKFINIY